MTTLPNGGPAMTPEELRHWRYEFAKAAMQGIYAGRDAGDIPNYEMSKWAIEEVVALADALLAELARTERTNPDA